LFFVKSAAARQLDSALPSAAKPRVVGLVRVSTASQAEEGRGGLARQHTVIRLTVERKGLDCLRVYELTDVSGTTVLQNPQILEILGLVKSGIIQGLVVADLDRLFRPDCPTDFAILQVFKDTGAVIHSGDIEYDLSSKHGLLFSHIRSAISGYELSLMKERQQGAKEEKRRAGKCPTNSLTLPLGVGYDRQNEKFFWAPEIVKVQELFTLFDSEGIRNYCELQRRTGIKHATIRVILRNPIYTGWRVIHSRRGEKRVSRNGKNYRVKVKRGAEDVIRVQVLSEPAISEEVFKRVGLEMERTKLNHIERFRSAMAVNLAAGVGVCAHCGEPLFCTSGKKSDGIRHGYYQCKSNHYLYKQRLGGCKQPTLRQSDVDAAVMKFTGEFLTDPDRLTGIINDSVTRRKGVVVALRGASSEDLHSELKRRDQRILAAYEAGAMSVDELRTRRESVRKDMEGLTRAADRAASSPEIPLAQTARAMVKAALRFSKLDDKRDQKRIITEIFSELHFRDRALVSFRFRDAAVAAAMPGAAAFNETIHLSEPLVVTPEKEELLPFQRRCIKCQSAKDTAQFYRRLNVCNDCRRTDARRRHVARAAARRAEKQA
jgi:DNA invertase Pin-like site-specific DNA recombinase